MKSVVGFFDIVSNKLNLRRPRKSYSQCGEDIIVDFILHHLSSKALTYLDIGAHHPMHISNTYLFYCKGGHGVCIEPDPVLFKEFRRWRGRDTCLNVGIGASDEMSADFYVMSTKSLSTFSRNEAERYTEYGKQKIEKIIKIPLVSVNNILNDYFPLAPDFVSLDVEGMDLEILSAFDFTRFRPKVFCVETLSYTEDRTEEKCRDTIAFMEDNGYFLYADTYINTIFVDREFWQNCR